MSRITASRLLVGLMLGLTVIFTLAHPGNTRAQQGATAIPAGPVLYAEDFGGPGTGWNVFSNQFGACSFDNGEYVIRNTANGGVHFTTRDEVARDFVVEVDVRMSDINDEQGASLLVRAPQIGPFVSRGYMRLSLRPASGLIRFGATTNDNGNWSYRLLTEVTDHPAVSRGSATNRLGLKVLGSSFIGYVNGHEVVRADDGTYANGSLGLEVHGPRGTVTEARFDNLVVSEIGDD